MIERLAFFLIRRRKPVLWITALILVLAAAVGGQVSKKLSGGGYQNPGSQSYKTMLRLEKQFGVSSPNLVLLVKVPGSINSPDNLRRGAALEQRLRSDPHITQVVSYFSTHSPDLLSTNGHEATILALIKGSEAQANDALGPIYSEYESKDPSFSVGIAGFAAIFRQANQNISKDLLRADMIAIPVTFVALIVVFGGLVAAALPLVVGGTSILATYLFLRILVSFTPVSVYALNMTTALGLGLGIDYALFILTRYREQLRNNKTKAEALVITLDTAGRTVVFSALTVAMSLSALYVFPLFFLRSFAYVGIVIVLSAMLGAVIVLPAMLAVLGPKVNAGKVFNRKAQPHTESPGWHRIAVEVMKRPVHVGAIAVILVVSLGVPFLHIRFGLPDDRNLPRSASTHVVTQALRQDFSNRDADALTLIADIPKPLSKDPAMTGRVDAYATMLSALPGVHDVEAVTGSYVNGVRVRGPSPGSLQFANPTGVRMQIVPSVESYSAQGKALVHAIRNVPAPFVIGLTGTAAQFVDVQDAIFQKLPWAFLIIGVASFVLLFLLTGSVVMPIKALLLNILSLSAVFGSLVWIFQDGRLRWLIGDFQPAGYLDVTTPVLLFCVAFGLSMDYEVFLLSRIKEEYDRTHDTRGAVAFGLGHTGRIVTSAAVLFAVVNLSFVTSQVTFVKLFGIGLTVAVVMDATIIRGLLVPAAMRLMGDFNWWAPRWARRVHGRIGISESGDPLNYSPVAPSVAGSSH